MITNDQPEERSLISPTNLNDIPIVIPEVNNSKKDDSIKMHIVVTSHLNPGWKSTFEELYEGTHHQGDLSVKDLLDQVFEALVRDPKRKYSMSDVSLFERWWKDLGDQKKKAFKGLVENDQFEFINGGWVSNDETCTYYEDIIDNFILGQRWLKNNIGVESTIGLQVDSLGNSATHVGLMAQAGYEASFVSRVDENDTEPARREKRLQFNWKPKNPHDESIFTQVLYLSHDNIQFPPTKERVLSFNGKTGEEAYKQISDHIKHQSTALSTKNVLFLIYDDFYLSKEVEKDYDCIDVMGQYFEDHPELGIRTRYNHLNEYIRQVQHDLTNSDPKGTIPEKRDDFLSFVSGDQTGQTGFYTKDSEFKLLLREYSQYFNTAKLIFAKLTLNQRDIVLNTHVNLQHKKINKALVSVEKALSLAQHHNAITGIHKESIRSEYERQLRDETQKLDKVLQSVLVGYLQDRTGEKLKDSGLRYDWFYRDRAYQATLDNQDNITFVAFNPGKTRSFFIKVKLPDNKEGYKVVDEANNEIAADIITQGQNEDLDRYLYFVDEILDYSFKVYKLLKSSEVKVLEPVPIGEGEVSIQVDKYTILTITDDLKTFKHEIRTPLGETIKDTLELTYNYYRRPANGENLKNPLEAYKFMPENLDKQSYSKILAGRTFKAKHFTLVQIFRENIRTDIKVFHYYHKKGIEIETHLDLTHGYDNEKDIVLNVHSKNTKNEDIFYTDANGYYMQRREYNHQTNLANNYYPITSQAYIQDVESGQRLSIVTDRAQGVTSRKSGELEFLVHRGDTEGSVQDTQDRSKEVDYNPRKPAVLSTRHHITYSHAEFGLPDQRRYQQYDLDRSLQLWFYNSKSEKFDTSISVEKKVKLDETVLPDLVKVYIRSYIPNEYIVMFHNLNEDIEKFVQVFDASNRISTLFNSFADKKNIKVSLVTELSWTTTKLKRDIKTNILDYSNLGVLHEDGDGFSVISLRPLEIRTFSIVFNL